MKLGLSALVCAAGAVAAVAPAANAQLRVLVWNISNYGGADRGPDIQNAIYGVIPAGLAWAGRSMSPDAIVGIEFTSLTAVNTFVTLLNSAPGSPGDWAAGTFINGADTDSAFFYRTSKVTFLGNTTISVGGGTPAPPRNTQRFDIRLVGYSTPAASASLYATHMKAQDSSTDDEARRLLEAQRIRDDAQLRAALGWNFMTLGDTNIQNSASAEYQELVGSQANNTGRHFDPINSPGNWNNSAAFDIIHTQDPAGAGGMDDRHDQIVISSSLRDGVGFDYLGNSALTYSTITWNDPNHSYRAWGNDGTSFNATLKTTGNTFVGASIAQSIITCASTGGHLPIIADFRVPPKSAAVQTTIDFGSVPQGSPAPTQTLNVSNGANTALWTVNGISPLNYTLTASTGFTAPAGSFVSNAGAVANAHSLTMNTATPGTKTGTVTIVSNDPDVPSRVVNLTGIVTPPNVAPTANAGTDQLVNDVAPFGTQPVTLNGAASSDSDGSITSYVWKNGPTTLATGVNPTINLAPGTYTLTLTVTDNGGLTGNDSVEIIVNTLPAADAGTDQTVIDTDNSGSESVTLSGSSSTDSDGSISTYTWTEGATTLATGVSPTISLPVGPHTITLTVSDNRGATNTDTVLVTINPPESCPCVADFDASGGTPDAGDVDAFFIAWLAGDAAADADCSGGTPDAGDVDVFFIEWLAGGC
jgi:hypothetical protein